jgi:hypothetical protein
VKNEKELIMNVDDLGEGVYFLEMSFERTRQSQVKKVVVRR